MPAKRTKTEEAKAIKIGDTTFGELLGAVMKVPVPKARKKATKKKPKK